MSREALEAVDALLADVGALRVPNTPALRVLRRARSKAWRAKTPQFIFGVALQLNGRKAHRWLGFELIRAHAKAFVALDDRKLVTLSRGLDSWDSVDAFARILSGPAWAQGFASDALIDRWSKAKDRWFRRAALVSTIALNTPRDGGVGDAARTLAICRRLASDEDDMVEKALSWALRALSARDKTAVRNFIVENESVLCARVKREVSNKLSTGLKNKAPGTRRG